MQGQTVDPRALDGAISYWMNRIEVEGLGHYGTTQTTEFYPAAGNAINMLTLGLGIDEQNHLMLDVISGSDAFQVGWDLAIDCACAVVAEPLGNPSGEIRQRIETRRKEFFQYVNERKEHLAKTSPPPARSKEPPWTTKLRRRPRRSRTPRRSSSRGSWCWCRSRGACSRR